MHNLIASYQPIALDEMSSIKLLNRTDTKFVTTLPRLLDFLTLAQPHYRIQETDGDRILPYHTLYFDTGDNEMYLAHHNGKATRQKLRIRSYVNSRLSFLEVKNKDNHKRTKKKRFALPLFDPSSTSNASLRFGKCQPELEGCEEFLARHLRYDIGTLAPSLENRFDRITLVNNDKTERLTIDSNLKVRNPRNGTKHDFANLVIIELKRDGLKPTPCLELLRQLRIMPMRFSKYCMGMATTDSNLKQNRFKERLYIVNKMMYQ